LFKYGLVLSVEVGTLTDNFFMMSGSRGPINAADSPSFNSPNSTAHKSSAIFLATAVIFFWRQLQRKNKDEELVTLS
jgi:hypothetical protein